MDTIVEMSDVHSVGFTSAMLLNIYHARLEQCRQLEIRYRVSSVVAEAGGRREGAWTKMSHWAFRLFPE